MTFWHSAEYGIFHGSDSNCAEFSFFIQNSVLWRGRYKGEIHRGTHRRSRGQKWTKGRDRRIETEGLNQRERDRGNETEGMRQGKETEEETQGKRHRESDTGKETEGRDRGPKIEGDR